MKKLVKESLLESRFSEDKIEFNQQDVYDKCADSLFYIDKLKENILKIKDLPSDFKFDLAFEKLQNAIQKISDSTGINNKK